jgi:glycosyltransferase involved in cell wall biosynthesis
LAEGEKMKVAMLTSWLVKCGIASYSWYLSHALANEGCEIYVVRLSRFGTRDENYLRNYAEEVPLDVDVIHIQNEYSFFQWQELVFYSALKDRLTFFNKKIPIVTTMHATGNLTADRVVASYSDAVIVHNVFGANQFKLPCAVIPMGVQKVEKHSSPELCKKRWGLKGPTVGMFGFISAYKGLELLIRAIAQNPDATLIVGGGWHVNTQTPYIVNVKRYANRVAPGRVLWLGYLSEEDMPLFFGACDVMVYAHHMISESMSLNTALAYGKATLTSNLPPFREKAKKNVVAVFTDADDLAGKLKALLVEPELRRQLEANAEKYAKENSWTNISKKHLKLYESLLTV